jgi:hypothetical protein
MVIWRRGLAKAGYRKSISIEGPRPPANIAADFSRSNRNFKIFFYFDEEAAAAPCVAGGMAMVVAAGVSTPFTESEILSALARS